jgi:hypothetical protein
MKRDSQRSRVYAWENRVIAPHDRSQIAFGAAQAMVDAIWAEAGLVYPPEVKPLPQQARNLVADATRLCIRLGEATPSWCLLHELAHAMTSTHEGRSDQHGADFMGIYLQLLDRYMRIPGLRASAEAAGIKVNPQATPAFLDAAPVRGRGSAGRTRPHPD